MTAPSRRFDPRGLGPAHPSSAVSVGAAAAVLAVFAWLCFDMVRQGVGVVDWQFLVHEPSDAGRAGGIAPILVSTLWILAVCLAATVPLGLLTSIYLAELTPRDDVVGRITRRSLDALAAVPSIVFGLFGNAFFAYGLGLGLSILSGGLTLACMILPLFIRTVELGLRAVPASQRDAAHALGLRPIAIAFRVVLPQATPAIVAGLVLGIGRALAETAALIFTSGYQTRFPTSVFDSGRSLSVHIFDLGANIPGGDARAYGSALVLVAILFLLNRIATSILRLFGLEAPR